MHTFNIAQEARDYSKSNPSETVELKYYHDNGQLDEHSFYVNGKPHGEYKEYWSDGQLSSHYFYVNGLEHGESKDYFDNGKLAYHRCYVDGKRHGEYKSYDDNGQLLRHCFFVNSEDINVDHLNDGSYKSLCIKHTLFDGNLLDEVI